MRWLAESLEEKAHGRRGIAQRRQQEVDGGTGGIDGPIEAIFAQPLEKVKFATRREELGCLADSEAGFSALQHSHNLRPSCSTALRSGALACGPEVTALSKNAGSPLRAVIR
jgi:hypothetical protein